MTTSYIKGTEIPHFKLTTSILKILLKSLQEHGDATALVEGETGKTASYAEVLQQGRSIAAGLCSKGVTGGDVVVLCCEKSILAFSMLLGALLTGATVALVPTPNAHLVPELTKGHAVKAVLCDTELLDSVSLSVQRLSPKPCVVATTNLGDPVTSHLLNNSEPFSVYEVEDPEKHVAIILYSSGTTGVPKGAEVTDYALQLSTKGSNSVISFLGISPLYWTSGFYMWLGALIQKRLMVMSNSMNARENFRLVAKYKIEGLFIGAGGMSRFTFEFEKNPVDLSSVKRIFVGGETNLEHNRNEFVSKVLKDRLNLETMYGSSEAGVLAFNINNPVIDEYKVVSSGKVLPGSQIKILGEDGEVVPLGSLGELWVKSINMTTGYWNKQELNDQMFDSEGFLRTGDLGHFDKDGNLFCVGRISDVVMYKEKMVPWTEVENLVTTHPAVLEAVVVGRPHPQDTHHLAAFVVRKPGADVTEAEIEAYVNDQLDDFKRLRGGVYFLDILPRTVTGKVIRSQLRELKFD